MRARIILAAILLAGLLLLLFNPFAPRQAPAQPAPAEEEKNPYFEDFVTDFEAYFESQMEFTGTPGAAVAIIHGNNDYLLKGYGMRKRSSKEYAQPVDEHTVFRIGSLSKGMAAALAGTFVEDGLFNWSDKVKSYVPEFSLRNKSKGENVTIAHLLSHSTGISYHAYTNLVEQGWTMDEIIPKFKTAKTTAEAGRVYSYQNAIFSLVGEVMEQKDMLPLDSIYKARIFEPLGMEDASVTFQGIHEDGNHATPHLFKNSWQPMPLNTKYYNAIPAGGVNASISDMSKYMRLMLGHREDVLRGETLDQLCTSRINTRNRRRHFSRWKGVEEAHYGLGWRIIRRAEDVLFYHGGYVNGFKSEILINKEDGVAICILTNANSRLSARAIPVFIDKYDAYKALIQSWEKGETPNS